MNLFVDGGTGYRGSAVTAALRADGHTGRAHVRSIASAGRLPARAGPVAGDLGDAAWPRARTGESDGVVHDAMLLPGITVVNTALPSIQGEES